MKSFATIHVAGDRYECSRGLVNGAAIYNLVKLDPQRHHLQFEIKDDRDIPFAATDAIIIDGDERFSIADGPCPEGAGPALRQPIAIVINGEPIKGDALLRHVKLTFDEIAPLASDFQAGDGLFVELTDLPDAQLTPGIRLLLQPRDRLYTSPCGNVGFEPRLEADLQALRQQYGEVRCIDDGARTLVIVPAVALPKHWNRSNTDVLIHVPQGYPIAAMDMFWVPPGLTLADGRTPQNADLQETYGGQVWQRFSWHYPQPQRWDPATSGVMSHMRFVRTRLAQAN
ncbi:E2/UBC family protein [Mitsuaria sp. TWR114]|uniref:E2/UBC family protein n=1 Tax=Mitsuaria sp. TWR114 TaxID=2601731 RepID=UPI00164C01A9|nr:E2/UBC family protein [Mitsuaria sp. TWR114]